MATTWCRDSGIADKMMSEIVASAAIAEGGNQYQRIRLNQPLTLMHLATSSIVFGVGLILAGMAFCAELIYHKLHGYKNQK